MEWDDIETGKGQATMSGGNIQNLLQDEKLLQVAKEEWEEASIDQPHLSFSSTKEDLDKEVEWFESKLVRLLNNHAKVTRITAYSKRWWNAEVAKARKTWEKTREGLEEMKISKTS